MIKEYFSIIFALIIMLIAFNTFIAFAVKFDYAANTGDNDNYWFKLCVWLGVFAAVIYAVKRKKIFSFYNSAQKIIVPKYRSISIGLFAAACIVFAGILGTSVFLISDYSEYSKSFEKQSVVYNEGNIYNHYCELLSDGTFVYYDKYGKAYVDFNDVCQYDKDGNAYVKTFKSDSTYYVAEIDGEEISVPFEEAFTDETGNFVRIDVNEDDYFINKNYQNGGYTEYYFNGNESLKYFSAPEVSWDKLGNMYIEGNLLK